MFKSRSSMVHKLLTKNNNRGLLADTDVDETTDWLEGLSEVIERDGIPRAEFLLNKLIEHGRTAGGRFHTLHTTPYRNTIAVDDQPRYPGDLDLELRITAMHRWNALIMVMRANVENTELGGHIATYASIADLFEVGFNHFFRAPSDEHPGDLVYFQPHASPGVYARAFLEGRLTEKFFTYPSEICGFYEIVTYAFFQKTAAQCTSR